ncbi:hypothetical protein QR680_005218 [Steinernema hermaphroditum]|uniref:Ion transport domain-containing protein n=1 Tax=Steinernema hermaphroditum TaxID=289476 RepID=A0AA39HTF8_9BILA|nr:hypothetical protein QR680_005218 [Steinernema hermaphroditum]
MGAAESSNKQEEGHARRLDDKEYRLYSLVDLHGGGELIPWIRHALHKGDHTHIDRCIEEKLKDFMYNQGKGKVEAIAELVKRRNKERNAMLGALYRKKGKGKSGPNILEDFNQEGVNQGDLKKALKLLDGGGKGGRGESKYREITWKLDERGQWGENLVGTCMIQGTLLHNKLATKLMMRYPKMINDIFISEDHYGLSPLHLAIINEDPYMVNFLLAHGADVNQRCYGALFGCDDQKNSRTDSLEHEYVELSLKTNYTGKMYFGEYPLAFAACTNQFDCYRLLRARRGDPNLKDTNGNTVLHLTVIHDKLEMLRLAYLSGGRLNIPNKLNLTPLTLAAKLGKKTLFDQILKLESQQGWLYRSASNVSYPLAKLDTINTNGELNEDSALSLVVYGGMPEHLEFLDGVLGELLDKKWEYFARKHWRRSFMAFCTYYAVFFMAFMNRPFSKTTNVITGGAISINGQYLNYTIPLRMNTSYFYRDTCHLWNYSGPGWFGYIRMFCEPAVLVMVVGQLLLEARDIKRIGWKRWWQVLKYFPAKQMYKISLILIIFVVPFRFLCGFGANMLLVDNWISVASVIFTTTHFLYYCRAIKFVGPFVLMVYTIILKDMIRFMMIYAIFLVGFSQGFFFIFRSCERENELVRSSDYDNILKSPAEAALRVFIMTIGEFMVLYRELNSCSEYSHLMATIGKVMFFIYELFVSIMQFNLLIAMMTRTYEMIFLTRNEYRRQWAMVCLMIELALKPEERKQAMLNYSIPFELDHKKRAINITKKILGEELTEPEKEQKEKAAAALREEKRQLLKKRLKNEMTKKVGGRPTTSYFDTSPLPFNAPSRARPGIADLLS